MASCRVCFKMDDQGETDEEVQCINVRVLGEDTLEHFLIKKDTPLVKLMSVHSDRAGIARHLMGFRFKGNIVTDTDTLSTLNIKDGDTIDVDHNKTDDGKDSNEEGRYINLKVVGEDTVEQFVIMKDTPLGKLMSVHSGRVGIARHLMSFRFNGNVLNNTDTLNTLHMQDGDTIEVDHNMYMDTLPTSNVEEGTIGVDRLDSKMDDERKKNEESQCINMKMIGYDAVQQFVIMKDIPLRKLLNAYSDRIGMARHVMSFTFKGNVINDTDTLNTLNIKDGDTIDTDHNIFIDALTTLDLKDGGTIGMDDGSDNNMGDESETNEKGICIILKVIGEVKRTQFRIMKDTPLGKLMDVHSDRTGIARDFMGFTFNGNVINDTDTVTTLNIQDGDTIEVVFLSDSEEEEESRCIKIRIRGKKGDVVHFVMREHDPFGKIMTTYCKVAHVDRNLVKFKFKGTIVKETDTITTLDMDHGDTIKVKYLDKKVGGKKKTNEYKCINLKVREEDSVVQFRIMSHSPLKHLMTRYCHRAGVARHFTSFKFNGNVINDTDTLTTLNMENGNTIEVDCLDNTYLDTSNMEDEGIIEMDFRDNKVDHKKETNETKCINLKVRGEDSIIQFKIKNSTPLIKLMMTYCDGVGLPIYFMNFKCNGNAINDRDTFATLNMDDGNTIEVDSLDKSCMEMLAAFNKKNAGTMEVDSLESQLFNENKIYETKCIKVKLLQDGKIVQYGIMSHNSLWKMLNLFCDHAGTVRNFIVFKSDGKILNENMDHNSKLKIEDVDTIEIGCPDKKTKNKGKQTKKAKHINVFGPGGVVGYVLMTDTPLEKVMTSYCFRVGIARRFLNFKYNGNVMKDADTLASLEVKSGDRIEAEYRDNDDIGDEEPTDEPERVMVNVRAQSGKVVNFVLTKFIPLEKVMRTYCQFLDIPRRSVNFRFKGRLIHENDTLMTLNAERGDAIDVYTLYRCDRRRIRSQTTEEKSMAIKIIDENNATVEFGIKKDTSLGMLMERYCARAGLARNFIGFRRFDGKIITDTDTFTTLNMRDGETIESYCLYSKMNTEIGTDEVEYIHLKMVGEQGNVLAFQVKMDAPLEKVMMRYCRLGGLHRYLTNFRFDGDFIKDADTPTMLNMEDGDMIEVEQEICGYHEPLA